MAQHAPIEVYSARDTTEAYFVRNLLQQAGIEALVVGDVLRGIVGELPPLQTTPGIWVSPHDAERARLVVAEYDLRQRERATIESKEADSASNDPDAEPFCYHCGESVRSGESPCPACGKPLEWGRESVSVENHVETSTPNERATLPNPSVLLDVRDGVAILTLNHPEKRNPLSRAMLTALEAKLDRIASDAAVRAVIVRAAGPAFSAGHDLRELVGASEEGHRSLFALCSRVMESIRNLAKPVIAEVQGIATAAGCQLAATCDLVVASENATFATPGVKIGLFCSTPAVAVSRAVPSKKAMEMLLTGSPISAREAERFGLVNRVVPLEQLSEETMKLARQVGSASADTLGLGKRTFYKQLPLDRPAAYELTSRIMVENAQTHHAQEGMQAFLERRAPVWEK
jgi:enoyl-CoA hydratase/carnithine racemase